MILGGAEQFSDLMKMESVNDEKYPGHTSERYSYNYFKIVIITLSKLQT